MAEPKWTAEETFTLLRAVREREILYNPSSVNYRNRSALLTTWQEVATAVGNRSVLECKDRWKVLRGQYRKRILSMDKPPNEFPWHWHWASEMSFLDNFVSTRKARPKREEVHHPEEDPSTTPLVVLGDGTGKEERKRCMEALKNEIREYLMMKRSTEGVDPFFLSVSRDMLNLSDRDKSLFKLRVHETLHEFLHGKEGYLRN